MGKADDPLKRWKRHCKPDPESPYKSNWVSELRALGLTPGLEILEEVPFDQWQEIEREYIRVFRMIGIRLTNTSFGGEGNAEPTLETRKKMSDASKGRKRSKEHGRKIGLAQIGNTRGRGNKGNTREFSLEHCEKLSVAGKGTQNAAGSVRTDKEKENISRFMRGNSFALGSKRTPEFCKRLSEVRTGEKNPNFGKKQSVEHIAKRVASIKKTVDAKKEGAACS